MSMPMPVVSSNRAATQPGSLVLNINRQNPFNPSTYIRNEWRYWCGPVRGDGLTGDIEQDARALNLSQIDWNKVAFENGLIGEERSITGEEKLRRLKRSDKVLLDVQIVAELYADYKAEGDASVLERLRMDRGIICLAPLGTTLRCPAGGRYSLPLTYDNHHREWDWGGLFLGCLVGADCLTPVLSGNALAA